MEQERNVPDFGTQRELAEQMEAIFRERDAVYQEREERLKNGREENRKEKAALLEERMALEEEKTRMQEERRKITGERESIQLFSEKLEKHSKELEEKSGELLQERLRLEQLKNEQLRALSEREGMQERGQKTGDTYEAGNVTAETLEEALGEALGEYLPKKEHEEILREKEEENRMLRAEKQKLLKQFMNLKMELTEKSVEKTEEPPVNVEELTAQIVKNYLEKNCPEYGELEILHTEGKNQLSAKKGNLTMRFVFENPCYFDISAERKDGRRLRDTLEELNRQYRDVKFTAEDGRAVATSYFSPECPVYELIRNAETVSGLFRS